MSEELNRLRFVLIFSVILFLSHVSGDDENGSRCDILSFFPLSSTETCLRIQTVHLDSALSCVNKNLTEIPKWPCGIGSIVLLSKNKVQRLRNKIFQRQFKNTFDLERVLELDVSQNQITTIDVEAFAGLASLEHLDLSSNSLREVPTDALTGLRALKRLSLSNNLFSHITTTAFQALNTLTQLRLRNCSISTLSPFVFRNLSALVVLDLGHNFLSQILPSLFVGLGNLGRLNLEHNLLLAIDVITTWPPQQMPLLRDLRLDGNPMVKMSPRPTWYQEHLRRRRRTPTNKWDKEKCEKEELHCSSGTAHATCENGGIECIKIYKWAWYGDKINLRRNRINILDDEIFKRQFSNGDALSRVKDLDLSHNVIKFIYPRAFEGFHSLQLLDLSFNHLSSLSIESLQGLRKLRKVILSGNPISFEDDDFSILNFPLKEFEMKSCKVTSAHFWSVVRKVEILERLDLGYNLLTHIPEDGFEGAEIQIKSLSLDYNQLVNVSQALFTRFLYLKELFLDGNSVVRIGAFGFNVLQHVEMETLSLSFCNISSLQPFAFGAFPNLKNLNLSFNELSGVSEAMLAGLFHLSLLNLERNQILTLGERNEKLFLKVPKLLELNLRGNFKTNVTDEGMMETERERNQLLSGVSCNCNLGGDFCVGVWMESNGKEGRLKFKCEVTSIVFKTLESLTFANLKFTLTFFILTFEFLFSVFYLGGVIFLALWL